VVEVGNQILGRVEGAIDSILADILEPFSQALFKVGLGKGLLDQGLRSHDDAAILELDLEVGAGRKPEPVEMSMGACST
jgi:hypothetical protein